MARAKKCDRCGKLYEHYEGGWTRKYYDFCPDCMRKLETFIKNEEVLDDECSTESENV